MVTSAKVNFGRERWVGQPERSSVSSFDNTDRQIARPRTHHTYNSPTSLDVQRGTKRDLLSPVEWCGARADRLQRGVCVSDSEQAIKQETWSVCETVCVLRVRVCARARPRDRRCYPRPLPVCWIDGIRDQQIRPGILNRARKHAVSSIICWCRAWPAVVRRSSLLIVRIAPSGGQETNGAD